MPGELPPTRSLVIPWEGMGWGGSQGGARAALLLGPRRKWGFQEATALFFFFFFCPFQREGTTTTAFSLDIGSSARRWGSIPPRAGGGDLRRRGPNATLGHGAAQRHFSFSHSSTLSKVLVHSFIRRAFAEGLLSPRPRA